MRTKVFSIISILAIAILMVACAGSGSNPTPPPNPPTPVTKTTFGARFGSLGLGSTILKKTTTTAFNWSLTTPAFAQTTTLSISGAYHGACRNLESIDPVGATNQYALMNGLGTWDEIGCQGERHAETYAAQNLTDSGATLGNPASTLFTVKTKGDESYGGTSAVRTQTIRTAGAPVFGDGILSSFTMVLGKPATTDTIGRVWVAHQGGEFADTGMVCNLHANSFQCNGEGVTTFNVQNYDRIAVVVQFQGSRQDLETFITKQ